MDCVHSVVWYAEDESYVVASYKADTILSATDKHVMESVHVTLSSLLEGGICVCSSIFMFFENSDVKFLSFCCKNMSTHSFVSFRNISILSLICLSSS